MTLIEILEDLGIPYKEGSHRHVTAGWVGICCPFCGDSAFKLGINQQWGGCSCWSCGPHKLAEALVEATGLPWSQILPLVKGIGYSHSLNAPRLRRALVLPQGLQPLGQPHKAYLTQRGLNPEALVKLWGIQGIGLHSRLAWRIFIPIHYRDKVVSWTTRSLADTGRRYIAASAEEEAMSAKAILFGEDFCRHSCIVTEGPFDAVRIGPGTVAVMGTSYTQEQLAKIAKYPTRVICFDTEDTAQQRAIEMMWTLSTIPGQTINIRLETGKDPASADEEEVQEIRRRFLE